MEDTVAAQSHANVNPVSEQAQSQMRLHCEME